MNPKIRCKSEDLKQFNCNDKCEIMRRHSLRQFSNISKISKKEPQLINERNLSELLTNFSGSNFNRVAIIDCRFSYEFRNGRIISAVNPKGSADLCRLLKRYNRFKTCYVFYCDHTLNRSKIIHSYMIELAKVNGNENFFKNSFILTGGFNQFLVNYNELCVGGYISKNDQRFVENGELRRSASLLRKEFLNFSKKKNKLVKFLVFKRTKYNEAEDVLSVWRRKNESVF